jgi:hypothetical protein
MGVSALNIGGTPCLGHTNREGYNVDRNSFTSCGIFGRTDVAESSTTGGFSTDSCKN